MDLNQVTIPALDIARSAAFYRRMGFRQIVDSPRYARFECPEGDGTFSLHVVDKLSGPTGVTIYFEHEELDTLYEQLAAGGFEFESEPTDRQWLWRFDDSLPACSCWVQGVDVGTGGLGQARFAQLGTRRHYRSDTLLHN